MHPNISVIIPVYNVEKYLEKCVYSILKQTYCDFEIILIDDGSPDNSGKICDKLQQTDDRIRVYHKENGGVSSARNLGIDHAGGEWITFVDADDWLEEDTFAHCSQYFKDFEMIRFSMEWIYKEGEVHTEDTTYVVKQYPTKKEYLEDIISKDTIVGVASAFYKRDIINAHNLRFSEHAAVGEDWLFLTQYVYNVSTVCFIPDTHYKYNQCNENSALTTMSPEKIEQLIDVYKTIEKFIIPGDTSYANALHKSKMKIAWSISICWWLEYKFKRKFKRLLGVSFYEILTSDFRMKERLKMVVKLSPLRVFFPSI